MEAATSASRPVIWIEVDPREHEALHLRAVETAGGFSKANGMLGNLRSFAIKVVALAARPAASRSASSVQTQCTARS